MKLKENQAISIQLETTKNGKLETEVIYVSDKLRDIKNYIAEGKIDKRLKKLKEESDEN